MNVFKQNNLCSKNKSQQCNECEKKYSSKRYLTDHIKTYYTRIPQPRIYEGILV